MRRGVRFDELHPLIAELGIKAHVARAAQVLPIQGTALLDFHVKWVDAVRGYTGMQRALVPVYAAYFVPRDNARPGVHWAREEYTIPCV